MNSLTKKILAILVAVAVIAAVLYGTKKIGVKETYEQTNSAGIQAVGEKLAMGLVSEDSDKDNLPDWEEKLWKTDPLSADSDQDGSPDGDEVRNNRDPLKKGPDDAMEKAEIEKTYEELTPTQKLSREIFAEYLNAKMSGNFDENTKQQIMQSAMERGTIQISAPSYDTTNLNVSRAEDPESVKKYQKDFFGIFTSHFQTDDQNEQKVLYNALENEDAEAVMKLKDIAELYRTSVKELLAMSVPIGAVATHLTLVNNLSIVAESVEAMSKVYSDPLTAMAGYRSYDEATTQAFENLADLSLYVGSKTGQEPQN